MNDSYPNDINDCKIEFQKIEDELKDYRSRIDPSKRRLFVKELKSRLYLLSMDISHIKNKNNTNVRYTVIDWDNVIDWPSFSVEKALRYTKELILELEENKKDNPLLETIIKEKPALLEKMLFKKNSELLKSYLNRLVAHNIIKSDIERALNLQDKILFIGEYPEKDVSAFMYSLNEDNEIKEDTNQIISSCFRKESGEWDKKLLSKYRNKFKDGQIKNHIKIILKK